MNGYIYDETQGNGHGFSFSIKADLENNSPRLSYLNTYLEKRRESPLQNRKDRNSSTKAKKGFDLSPELTLDDLREKLKNDEKNEKKGNKNENENERFQRSSLKNLNYLSGTPDKGLIGSISSHYEYIDKSGDKSQRRLATDGTNETEDHYLLSSTGIKSIRPLSTTYRSPLKSDNFERRESLSPLHSKRSLTTYLKSPTNLYNETSNITGIFGIGKESEKQRAVLRSRSPTSNKGYGSQHLGSSYLGSSSYRSQEQELKEKIEQFNKKLNEIQEGLSQSKNSQDPYQISLHSMKPLAKDDMIDGISSQGKDENRKRNIRQERDENSKISLNRDEKEQPLNIGNLAGSQSTKQESTFRRDYTEGWKEMKQRYSDMFKPTEMKTMINPYKILKQRFDHRLEQTVKGYIEETGILQSELNNNLFYSTTN